MQSLHQTTAETNKLLSSKEKGLAAKSTKRERRKRETAPDVTAKARRVAGVNAIASSSSEEMRPSLPCSQGSTARVFAENMRCIELIKSRGMMDTMDLMEVRQREQEQREWKAERAAVAAVAQQMQVTDARGWTMDPRPRCGWDAGNTGTPSSSNYTSSERQQSVGELTHGPQITVPLDMGDGDEQRQDCEERSTKSSSKEDPGKWNISKKGWKMTTFDGRKVQQFEFWVDRWRRLAEEKKLTGRDAVWTLLGFILNPALDRLRRCMGESLREVQDPEVLISELRRMYNTEESRRLAHEEFQSRDQRSNESVRDYMEELVALHRGDRCERKHGGTQPSSEDALPARS